MNWLTDFVKAPLEALGRKEAPDNLWSRCPSCEQMLFNKELEENCNVCKHCEYHFMLPPKERAAMLFDNSSYKILTTKNLTIDPLHFKDSKRYPERLRQAQKITAEAAMVCTGKIQDILTVTTLFDFRFIGGSMGTMVGEALLQGAETALSLERPYITISSSGGARMQEGILSLMQMPRSMVGISKLRKACLPFISILAHPTTGGVAASFASVGDINLSEPGATIGFTGARVIKEAMRTELPDGFQTAEFQLEKGLLDGIIHRHQLKKTLGRLISFLMHAKQNPKKTA